ncbi:MAG: hypothetical protein Q9195_004156 [Heterodermia aff. obscurata]
MAPTNLLRALGLGIVNYLLGHIGHRDVQEPAKVVVARSYTISLARNAVHIIPVGGALAVIYLNFTGFYVGANLKNINALQFAAKLHELTMIASLAQVLLAAVRAELVLGDGLPYGALFSGLRISQPSYLWSMEFWGSTTAPSSTLWKKLRLIVIPLVLILLAATVGPSSAIALIPRLGSWPAGQTHIWLNATDQELFPTEVNDLDIPVPCANTSAVPILNSADICPSSGWQTIAGLTPSYRWDFGPSNSNWPNVSVLPSHIIGAPSTMQLVSQDALRSMRICEPVECSDFLATVQPGSVANALATVARFWRDSAYDGRSGIGKRLSSFRSFNHSMDVSQPFVGVSNGYGYEIEGPDDISNVSFPSGMNRVGEGGYIHAMTTVNVTSISRSELYYFGDPTQLRLVFVDLTDSGITDTNLGFVLLDPRAPSANQPYTTGLIAAGWGVTNMHTSPNVGELYAKVVQSPGFTGPYTEDSDTAKRLFADWPLKKISLSKTWADYTNPVLPELNTSIYSALASLNDNGVALTYNEREGQDWRQPNIAGRFQCTLIAALIANGLSNLGADVSLQGNIALDDFYDPPTVDGKQWILHNKDLFTVDASESADWLRLQVDSTIEGLAYSTNGLPVKFALAILIAYCVVAVTYVLCTSVTGVSSASWDTLAELTALAVNSPAAAELRNTCAGIASMALFKTQVRVEAIYEDDGSREKDKFDQATEPPGGHLQLVFGNDNVDTVHEGVKMNTKYGALVHHTSSPEVDD